MCSACASRSPSAREHRRRAVGPLLDVRARRRPAQHRAHLVGDPAEPGDQHLQRRRRRGVTTDPPEHEGAGGAGLGRQPSGTQIVQSGSAMATGPDGGGRGRARAGRSGRSRSGCDAVARRATTSTGASGRAKPLRRRWASWNAADGRHGELVALARVAAVDRGRGRRRSRPTSSAASAASRRRASAERRVVERASATSARGRAGPATVSRPTADSTPARAGHDHRGHAERVGQRAGVQRPGAAEGDERQRPRIDAALDRHRAQGPLHRRRRPPGSRPSAVTPAPRQRPLGGVDGRGPARRSAAPAGMRPATRSASVTVGSVPPRP